ncbi:MAG: Ldh family oxidoreductase [Patescibacteria group bacterium]
MRIQIIEVEKLLKNKLRKIGFTTEEAKAITFEYISGELKGKGSHGVFGFIKAYNRLKETKRGHYKVVKDTPTYAFIEGNQDIGQIVAYKAIELAIKKAKKTGIAMVGGNNIHSFLRPGTWAEVAARKGMIALCFNYGGSPAIAPTGAREAILATNPIGIGIPYKEYPFVIDMAVSERAFNQISLAKALGKKIPSGWAIDKNGKNTNDPNAVTSVLPFGGYKGYILALALEILTGPFVRTKVGKSTKKFRGLLFIVIDPYVFTTKSEFSRDMNKLIKEVDNAKKIKGVKDIHIPGEVAYKNEIKKMKSGYFDIDKNIIDQIEKL